MHPRVFAVIIALGVLLAFGIDTSQLTALAIIILLFIGGFTLILRGKWLPQFWGSLVGLLVGPCLVAVVLRVVFAQLHFSFAGVLSFGWAAVLLLAAGICLAAAVSYAVVKRRLRLFHQGPPPALNERRPVYAPRRRDLPEE